MKTINFSFRDKDGEVLVNTHLVIRKGMNWLDLEEVLSDMLSDATGKREDVSAAILCSQWLKVKEFPNGMHFFINYNNEWGFTSVYLFREG